MVVIREAVIAQMKRLLVYIDGILHSVLLYYGICSEWLHTTFALSSFLLWRIVDR